MKTEILEKDIVNQPIENILCLKLEEHEHTQKWVYSFLIVFRKGDIILKLNPDDLVLFTELINSNDMVDIPIQIIGGGYMNELVKTIVFRTIKGPDLRDSHNYLQYGLLLSTNKILVNLYLGNGGSKLHLEDFSEFTKYYKGEWKDYWTNEIIV